MAGQTQPWLGDALRPGPRTGLESHHTNSHPRPLGVDGIGDGIKTSPRPFIPFNEVSYHTTHSELG